jgi:hypothetical protein
MTAGKVSRRPAISSIADDSGDTSSPIMAKTPLQLKKSRLNSEVYFFNFHGFSFAHGL